MSGLLRFSLLRSIPKVAVAGAFIWFAREAVAVWFVALVIVFGMMIADVTTYALASDAHDRLLRAHGEAYSKALAQKVAEHGIDALIERRWTDLQMEFDSRTP